MNADIRAEAQREAKAEALAEWQDGNPMRQYSEWYTSWEDGYDAGFSLAAVPDAATERVTENSVRHVKRLTTELQNKRESLNDQRREFRKLLAAARAERDAATEERIDRWMQLVGKGVEERMAAEAERDAALAAVERARAVAMQHRSVEQHNEMVPVSDIADLIREPSSADYLAALRLKAIQEGESDGES